MQAGRHRDQFLPIYEELGDLHSQALVLNNLGLDAYYEGRWTDAVDLYRRSLEANDRVGDAGDAGTVRNNIAEIRMDQGRYGEARELLEVALRAGRATSYSVLVGVVTNNLGRLESLLGDTAAADARFAAAHEALGEIGSERHRLEVTARQAERHVLAAEHVRALELAGMARAEARRLGAEEPRLFALLQRVAAVAKLQSGDREGAVVRLSESLEFARRIGAAYEELLALELLGRLGDHQVNGEAAAIAQRLGIIASLVVPLRG